MFVPRPIDSPRVLPARSPLEVRAVPGKGRGVFARQAYAVGEVIDVAPVILLHHAEKATYERLGLDQYLFEWDDPAAPPVDGGAFALCLGVASLLNHAEPANTDWTCVHGELAIELVATAPIAVGDELTIDYGEVWFPLAG